ncbi:MAG: hypothetical protein O3A85_07170 [Proteobacteria bacterium]|nr:hypothetical protein [Pseudomonadota bacterium]
MIAVTYMEKNHQGAISRPPRLFPRLQWLLNVFTWRSKSLHSSVTRKGDDDRVETSRNQKKMESPDIPQVLAEIAQFIDVYGSLIRMTALIFAVVAVSVMIKTEPAPIPNEDDNQASVS